MGRDHDDDSPMKVELKSGDDSDIQYIDSDEDEADSQETTGLTATELKEEKLYAGDTIEYYSMAFVFGDPRGHHIAKVLQVDHDELTYPLKLDSQELLANTQMIKRKVDRRGEDIEAGAAIWRKIRTFVLVDGQVKGKTRADRLNEGMKKAVSDGFQAMRKKTSMGKAAVKTLPLSAFFTAQPSKKQDKENKVATPPLKKDKDSKRVDQKLKLEVVSSRSSSSLSSTPSTSKSPSGRPLMKRPRIELTPPNRQRDDRSDRERDRERKTPHRSSTSPSSSSTKYRNHISKEQRSGGGFRLGDTGKLKPKIRLQRFVDSLEEKKKHHGTDLDSYLELERQQKEAKAKLEDGEPEKARRPESSGPTNKKKSSSSHGRPPSVTKWLTKPVKKKDDSDSRTKREDAKSPPPPAAAQSSRLDFILNTENGEHPTKKQRVEKPAQRDKHLDIKTKKAPLSSDQQNSKPPQKNKKSPAFARMDTWISAKK